MTDSAPQRTGRAMPLPAALVAQVKDYAIFALDAEGAVASWNAGAQHLKPGNTMPSYDQLEGPELRAVSAYLASLR